MTKFKEYLRAKGIKLECDYEFLPYNYIECVEAKVLDNYIIVAMFSNCAGWGYAVFNKHGVCGCFDEDDRQAYISGSHCDPELMGWLYDNGFTDRALNHLMVHYSPLYSSYSVYAAFLHVKAGIMNEVAFYKLVNKRCQQAINFYHIDTATTISLPT